MHPRFNLKLIRIIFKFWQLSNLRRKRQAVFLLILSISCGILELISLASVVPFLMVISEPNSLFNINLFSKIFYILSIDSEKQVLILVTLFFIAAAIFTMIIRVSALYFQGIFSSLVGSDFSKDVFEITLYKPYKWHLNKNSSEVINDLTNNIIFVVLYIKSFLNLITQFSVAICLIIGLLIFDGFGAVLSASIFLLSYILIATLQRKRFAFNGKFIVEANQKIIKILQESFTLIKEVILNNLQFQYITGFRELDGPRRRKEAENEFLKTAPRFVLEAICLSLFGVLAFIFILTKDNSTQVIYSLGTLAIGALKLLPAMQAIYCDWANLKTFYPGVISIIKIYPSENNNQRKNLFQNPYPFNERIDIQNLSFSYEEEKDNITLKNVNLTIQKGQRIGIIGSTGSGKSTLIDLLMCLLLPQKGSILIDGEKINFANQETLNSWRANISHVPQDIYLVDDKIVNNITLELQEENIDMKRVYEVSKKAMIFDFINTLPKGFDTYVGERGVRLSGGQKQRIGIARALYKKSKVLIFDEATSALDNKTEAKVMECIDNLIDEDITIILIAHRLSTIANCDIVFEVSNSSVKRVDSKYV